MSNLKDQLVRLGSNQPELRDHLRPILDHLSKRAEKDKTDWAREIQDDLEE